MTKEYTRDIVAYAYHGIDEHIPADKTVEVNLRDLMRVQATLQELVQFFHNPSHYPKLEDIHEYMGSRETNGAYKLLSLANYKIMNRLLPPEIEELFQESAFDAPVSPYYFEDKDGA